MDVTYICLLIYICSLNSASTISFLLFCLFLCLVICLLSLFYLHNYCCYNFFIHSFLLSVCFLSFTRSYRLLFVASVFVQVLRSEHQSPLRKILLLMYCF